MADEERNKGTVCPEAKQQQNAKRCVVKKKQCERHFQGLFCFISVIDFNSVNICVQLFSKWVQYFNPVIYSIKLIHDVISFTCKISILLNRVVYTTSTVTEICLFSEIKYFACEGSFSYFLLKVCVLLFSSSCASATRLQQVKVSRH